MNTFRLSLEFSKRELLTKHKGSLLGAIWLIASPVMLLLLYSAVFQFVFKAKWNIEGEDLNFTLALFCGLAPYFFFTEMIGKSPELVRNNSNLIKKVVFDRMSVPLSSTLSAMFLLVVNFTSILVYKMIDSGTVELVWFAIYLYLIPAFFMGLTIATVFASIGAYISDLSSIANFINPVLMFISPVFFDVDKVSPMFATIISFNPLTPIIVNIREVILLGDFNVVTYAIISSVTMVASFFGVSLYRALEEDFADLA